MYNVKLVDISVRKMENLKAKIEELETNSKIKNIRNLYRVSINLRRATSPELIQYVMRRVIWLQSLTVL
jgi:hypothetical protein